MVVIWMEIPISDDGIHGNLSTLPSIDGELFKVTHRLRCRVGGRFRRTTLLLPLTLYEPVLTPEDFDE